MRWVEAPFAAGLDPLPAPERAAVEAVRYLNVRFPGARLREVPVVRAAELDARADPSGSTRVWLALEALQVTGSFKVRGALVSVDRKRAQGHVVVASAGNQGVAIAYAASVLGLSATVCVPPTTTQGKREKVSQYGAELVVAPHSGPGAAEHLAREIARSRGSAFISAYGDVEVVSGNGSSLGLEIVRALGGVPERVLAPFCAGGLATGLAWALAVEARGPVERAVWGVESEATCSMAVSIERGRAVETFSPATEALADGLGAGLAAESFTRAVGAIAGIVVPTEAQMAEAMAHAYCDMGLVVEGSAAAALAPVLFGLPEPVRGGDLVVVLSGRNVDSERLEAVLRRAAESSPP
jgi:threonine dehydratase